MEKLGKFCVAFIVTLIATLAIAVGSATLMYGLMAFADYLYPVFLGLGLITIHAKFIAFFFCLAVVIAIVMAAGYVCADDEDNC